MRADDARIQELKRQLGERLAGLLGDWATHNAAARLGTDRSRIAELRRGNLKRFSLEQLIRLTIRAGKRVDVRVVD